MCEPGVVGETVRLFPNPILPPPHALSYHFQLALNPRVPPFRVKVVLCPRQIVVEEAVTLLAGKDVSLRLTTTLLQMELLQVPSALTK